MKALIGKVVSVKMDKTVIVAVESQRQHPLYKKFMKRTKRYKVDVRSKKVNVGDTVKIVSCRPLSSDKYFKLEGEA